METEYVAAHLQRVRLRVRTWFSLSIILASLFLAAHIARSGASNVTFWLHALGVDLRGPGRGRCPG